MRRQVAIRWLAGGATLVAGAAVTLALQVPNAMAATNLSIGAGADGSSKASGTSYGNVIDGDTSTYWSPTSATGTISVKWSSATTVASAVIKQASGGGTISAWQLLNYDTGAVLASGSGSPSTINFTSTSMKKISFVITSASAAPRIAEFETYASGGSTPTTSATASATASASASASASPSASSSPVTGAIYVSTSGSDSAAGTISAPTTLTSAITKIGAGGTIYMRGGTYKYSSTITIADGNDGTSSANKTLSAYPGESVVLDFSAMAVADANRGLQLFGNYWHFYGFTVQYAGDNGIFVGGSNNIIERTVTRYNRDSGLQISRMASTTAQSDWPANNLVLSAESHDNADPDGEDADGFAAKLTVGTGNVFRYCVSHNNIDDGWDLYTKTDTGAIGPVTIDRSLAYSNGTLSNGTVNANGDRNGYKLGGSDIAVNHIVTNSIAFKNGKHGFTYNSNPGSMTITSNVSIDNTERNFSFDAGTSVFKSNTSCRYNVSGSNDKTVGTVDSTNQFWTGTNGSRCSSYGGTMKWSFSSTGTLTVTFS